MILRNGSFERDHPLVASILQEVNQGPLVRISIHGNEAINEESTERTIIVIIYKKHGYTSYQLRHCT